MRVLVTGLFGMASLHAIRRLGQMGYEIHTAEGHRLAYTAFSKHVKRRFHLPSLRFQPEAYTRRVLELLETGRYDFYFPSYEEIIPMSRHRDRILAVTRTILPSTDVLVRMHDKKRMEAMAREIGIKTPKTFYPRSSQEARDHIASVKLPVVIKMRKTSGSAGFRKIYERSHFEKTYFDVVQVNNLNQSELPMIQELIEGPTTCTLHLCNQGAVLGELMYRGRRTLPRSGGTTVFRESVSDPASSEAAARIVRHLDFSGFCGFDFIIQETTGEPFLVDANCRITAGVTMAYHGGCDMVDGWLQIAEGATPDPLPSPEIGVCTKMQFADFVWLLESYANSCKDWRGERQLRKAWWAEKGFFYDIHSLRDPLPNIMLWIYILANCYKLVFTKFDSAQLFIFHDQYVEHEPEGTA